MYELLDNITNLTSCHFRHKVEKVKWRDDDTKEKIAEIREKVANDVYDAVYDIVSDAEYEIDNLIEQMEDKYLERPELRKDFNVFMLERKKNDEYL